MFGGLGTGEIILIVLALALIFGAKKIPELGSNLGKGIKNFKNSFSEVDDDPDTKQLEEDNS